MKNSRAIAAVLISLIGFVFTRLQPWRVDQPPGSATDVAFAVIRQRGTEDCALAALATLAARVNVGVDVDEVMNSTDVPQGGLTLLELRNLADSYGIKLTGVYLRGRAAERLKPPWIAHWRTAEGHYVVVEAHGAKKWTIADPAAGLVRYSDEEFMRGFTGYALVVESTSPTAYVNSPD
jgi:ABC-type bacteriocin/lantibiotic exporter with double-glycine peptidase domain